MTINNKLDNKISLPIALFHRDYLNYTGGHGKVWDYFNHIKQSNLYHAQIYFTPDSIFDNNNPWQYSSDIIPNWQPKDADLLFLAGMDWKALPNNYPKNIPIINLIQGIRHANPMLPLYDFLQRYAIRICVSTQVQDAILSTGHVNGPVFVIPNGLSALEPIPIIEKNRYIFIGALKNTSLGLKLAKELQSYGYDLDLQIERLPRDEFLKRLGKAYVAILLPAPSEGFFLPGLEAMALGTPAIMLDAGGNREYAKDKINSFICSAKQITQHIKLLHEETIYEAIRHGGLETSRQYSIAKEEESFLQLLKNIKAIWRTNKRN